MEILLPSGTFSALEAGPADGEPTLLLHGFPEGALCWEAVLPLLGAAGLRAVAPDQRGYAQGARPEGEEAYAIGELVQDAVGFLDELGWESAHVVGHDWGAIVAWALAAAHPDRVRTLTALSVPHPQAFGAALRDSTDQKMRSAYVGLFRMKGKAETVLLAGDATALRAMFTGSGLDHDAVARIVAPRQEPGALTGPLNWYRAMRPDDYTTIPAVLVPTTYLWGAADIAIGHVAAEGCADWVEADFRYEPLPGVSHWLPEQVPDVVARAVLDRVEAYPAEAEITES